MDCKTDRELTNSIKMSADLDMVFFDGSLLGNVSVKWVPRVDKGSLGMTEYSPAGGCHIELSAEQLIMLCGRMVTTPGKAMFSTLLHEMCQ